MRSYEVIFIVSSTLDDENASKAARDVISKVEQLGAEVVYSEYWGRRKLSFEVQKQRFGYYMLFHMKCDNAVLAEVDRGLKLFENVIKFMIVRLEEDKIGKESPLKVDRVDRGDRIERMDRFDRADKDDRLEFAKEDE